MLASHDLASCCGTSPSGYHDGQVCTSQQKDRSQGADAGRDDTRAVRHVGGGRRVPASSWSEGCLSVQEVRGGGVCTSRPKFADAGQREKVAPSRAEADAQRAGAEPTVENPKMPTTAAPSETPERQADQGHAHIQQAPPSESPAIEASTGGHRTPAPYQPPANQVPETGDSASPEHTAMLRRLGLNRIETMEVLKKDMVGSIDSRAPLRVVKYTVFKKYGRIPRSNEKVVKKMAKKLSEVPGDAKLGFISHRWLRPWHNKEDCEANGHAWGGMAHPDDAVGTKHRLICDGMEKLAEAKGWDINKMYLWIDFAGVEQDNEELLKAGVASLRGYITLCDAVLIPSPAVPEGTVRTVDMVPGGYGERGWMRLEAMSMYAVSSLKQVDAPEIWVAAGDGASFLERFDYVLKELPSHGVLFSEADREYIRGHETVVLEQMKQAVKRNGYIARHTYSVKCVAFDPKDQDGDLVASGGDLGVIKLVNRHTGITVWTVETKTEVNSLAFSRDGTLLAAGGSDGRVRIWTVGAGTRPVEKCSLKGHSSVVSCIAWNHDGTILASSSWDKKVKLWDLGTMKEKGTLKGHSDRVWSLAWNHDGSLLASGGADKTVRLWTPDGQERGTLKGHSREVTCVAWNHDGSLLVSGSGDKTVRLWSPDGKEKGTLRGHSKDNPECECTHDAGSKGSYDANPQCPVRGHSDYVRCVAFSPDGTLLASASDDSTVKLWDPTTMEEKGTLKEHSNWVYSVAWNHDGSLLASGSKDGTVRLWTPDGQEKGTLTGHSGEVNCVAFSPDGALFASASDDRTVKLWDPTTMEEKGTLKGHSRGVTHVAWNHDGSLLASGSYDETVCLWTPDGQEKGTLKGHSGYVLSVAFSPDSKTLASGSTDKTVRLWDLSGDVPMVKSTLKGHTDWVYCVTWNHDGTLLASGSKDGTVRLWTPDGQYHRRARRSLASASTLHKTLIGHSNDVRCVDFSPDGTLFASASDDRTVKLWDPTTMEEKGTLKGTVASWQGLDPKTKELAARTGQYIVTADGDMVYVYSTDPDGKKEGEPLACFRSPASVRTIGCRGTKVVAGCQDGQVLFLEAPLLAGVQ